MSAWLKSPPDDGTRASAGRPRGSGSRSRQIPEDRSPNGFHHRPAPRARPGCWPALGHGGTRRSSRGPPSRSRLVRRPCTAGCRSRSGGCRRSGFGVRPPAVRPRPSPSPSPVSAGLDGGSADSTITPPGVFRYPTPLPASSLESAASADRRPWTGRAASPRTRLRSKSSSIFVCRARSVSAVAMSFARMSSGAAVSARAPDAPSARQDASSARRARLRNERSPEDDGILAAETTPVVARAGRRTPGRPRPACQKHFT